MYDVGLLGKYFEVLHGEWTRSVLWSVSRRGSGKLFRKVDQVLQFSVSHLGRNFEQVVVLHVLFHREVRAEVHRVFAAEVHRGIRHLPDVPQPQHNSNQGSRFEALLRPLPGEGDVCSKLGVPGVSIETSSEVTLMSVRG